MSEVRYLYDSVTDIHYLEQGQGSPLLLLHGNGADAKLYLPLIQTLARHFRVVAPDLPGFGRSPARESRQMARYIAELELFINRKLRQPYLLMGHSMGGYLAYQLMLRKRTMPITRAVWMEAGLFKLDWKLALALQPYGLAHRFKKHNRAHVEDRLREWCWNYDQSDPVFREAFITSYFKSNRHVQGMLMAGAAELLPYRFDQISAPVLCLRGEKEQLLSRQTDWFAPLLPQGQRVVIPQAGHFLLGDNDTALEQEILTFLQVY
ncbi:MAG: alpha/beta hydrolase [Candidatus Sericytochromatia bacterium]|nr:alpha/beta hydrolase [Candidatus Sericytochromatia bacterium]